ncbi:MAG: transaldolase, partial [Bacteroidetes bacterium]
KPGYRHLVERAVEFGRKVASGRRERLTAAMDMLMVLFGIETLKIVPRRVSTEVDARLSFDTDASVAKARHLTRLYGDQGIPAEKVLIKVASTWEGVRAAHELEKEGIRCNLTLLFSMAQAIACAEAGVQLISPFVGRIYDWHRKERGVDHIPGPEDPGVHSVRRIFHYYKKFGYKTEVMGASFRNTGQIIELSGCDLLTISPELLGELEKMEGNLERRLDPSGSGEPAIEKISLDEKTFRWMHNEDPMAVEKLSDGIRRFTADQVRLEEFVMKLMS